MSGTSPNDIPASINSSPSDISGNGAPTTTLTGNSISQNSSQKFFNFNFFDQNAQKIGLFYGRWAVKKPVLCIVFGYFFLLIFSLPFFLNLSEGIRSVENRERGLSYRSDYGVWSPANSRVNRLLEKVKEDLPQWRREYEREFQEKTWTGRAKHKSIKYY